MPDDSSSREAAARTHEVLTNPERLRQLRATALLDAPTEEAFDRLTRLAGKLLSAPLSTVTLVDDDRQFYVSCTGFPEPLATLRETPLEFSFCRHTVVLGKPLIIPDVRGHPLVGDNPAIGQFGVTAYAGIPLLAGDGHALGTLCVMDFKVRDWNEDEVSSLTDLAAAVSTEIELRMDIRERVLVEQELQRALIMRDEVLGVVSHDLRNPVHTVSLASAMLLELLEDGPEHAETRQHLDIIFRAAQQMDGLIRDLLDAASIGAGRLSVKLGRHDADALLHAAGDVLRPIVEEAGLRFDVDVAPGGTAVLADPNRIVQLLSNLVGNAVKFTEPGGTLRIAAEPAPDGMQFIVSDSGAGIPEDELAHIFERFWRAERTSQLGAGLGLAISKGIVEAHNGQLRVESRVGEGTTFYFTLPTVADG
ncbi:MAG: GAF domain-containing sensor histidine kinase [Gemmatimonadetes bacterium]|nr:GAF domain-containing sensor histidine kinase [Gemmatimonadota bacterium]